MYRGVHQSPCITFFSTPSPLCHPCPSVTMHHILQHPIPSLPPLSISHHASHSPAPHPLFTTPGPGPTCRVPDCRSEPHHARKSHVEALRTVHRLGAIIFPGDDVPGAFVIWVLPWVTLWVIFGFFKIFVRFEDLKSIIRNLGNQDVGSRNPSAAYIYKERRFIFIFWRR